jgi:hypothetical protein
MADLFVEAWGQPLSEPMRSRHSRVEAMPYMFQPQLYYAPLVYVAAEGCISSAAIGAGGAICGVPVYATGCIP